MIYASSGINWIFVYEVIHEDDCILVLKDLGRFHKFDDDRSYKGQIDKWIDIIAEYVVVSNTRKLVEVQA